MGSGACSLPSILAWHRQGDLPSNMGTTFLFQPPKGVWLCPEFLAALQGLRGVCLGNSSMRGPVFSAGICGWELFSPLFPLGPPTLSLRATVALLATRHHSAQALRAMLAGLCVSESFDPDRQCHFCQLPLALLSQHFSPFLLAACNLLWLLQPDSPPNWICKVYFLSSKLYAWILWKTFYNFIIIIDYYHYEVVSPFSTVSESSCWTEEFLTGIVILVVREKFCFSYISSEVM